MNTFRKGLDLLLGAICCLVLAIMVGIACWQVVSRRAIYSVFRGR